MKRRGMCNGLVVSVTLHVVVLLLAVFGFPSLFDEPEPIETAMIVDLVEIAERTAAPPPVKKVEEPKEEPKPEPKQDDQPKPQVRADAAVPQPKQAPEPEPKKAEPKPVEPPKPDPEKAEPKKPEPKKPEPKKPEPKKQDTQKAKPKDDDPFKDLMKNVEKFREKSEPATPEKKSTPQQPSNQPRVLNAPLADRATMTELDAIRAQIERNWAVDTGAKGVESMVIPLKVRITPEGMVTSVDVLDTQRYGSDSSYRAVAESARRAVYRSQPIRYPLQKYETFKSMELVFSPQSRM
ncbi:MULTISPECIES: TonB C-terminal domain-containing protein [unclassified Haematospirillum]|uniref:TonB C-terminal domain-containing protein n=1 Tax=unclassified Haematospirillum TaxID=2622088 RepID=UPI0014390F6E|nr:MULTISPECIES: TonB C-terminal domain-containing protein [unclassified Haematospirillum]NKD54112.1 TonB C-terminal domain-containing protein [Haematospirillum sp. H4890]NKD74157.1 TonB C-terminal domain-containing protein [Haematospirillum sp. H4485]NKD87174.1 TonB C-terminal domain-containing protein [Haematospirillum sp. 15-248]